MVANRCFPSVVLHPKSLTAVVVNSSRVMGQGRFVRRLAHVMNSSVVSAVMVCLVFPLGGCGAVSPFDGDFVEVVGLEGFGEGVDDLLCGPVIGHSDEGAISEAFGGQALRMGGDGSDPVVDPHPIPEGDLPAASVGHHEDGHFLAGDECWVESHDGGVNRCVPQFARRRMLRAIEIL